MVKEEAVELVQRNGNDLKGLSAEFRGDKEVVLAAVLNDGMLLKYTSNDFKNDKEVVLAAVKNCGGALEYVGDSLKNDKEVVLEAVKNYDYTNDKLNKEMTLAILSHFGWAYFYFNEGVQRDKDVIDLVNKVLKKSGKSVDDYLCGALIELKKRYGVDTLEMALEIEAADIEMGRLINGGVERRVNKVADNRL